MKVIVFTEKDFSCVNLWFSRAFPNMSRDINKIVCKYNADGVIVSAANAAAPDDVTMQDIDALSKIEAFYHASETNDPDNNTSFKY